MRDPERIKEIIAELEKLWLRHPDYRLGQLLENFVFQRRVVSGSGLMEGIMLFFQEDDVTLEKLRDLNAKLDEQEKQSQKYIHCGRG